MTFSAFTNPFSVIVSGFLEVVLFAGIPAPEGFIWTRFWKTAGKFSLVLLQVNLLIAH